MATDDIGPHYLLRVQAGPGEYGLVWVLATPRQVLRGLFKESRHRLAVRWRQERGAITDWTRVPGVLTEAVAQRVLLAIQDGTYEEEEE